MWNSLDTGASDGMTASVITIDGANGDKIHAYVAMPDGNGPFPGVVLVHHMPGWDELYREFTRRFAQHGYNAICPDLYCRAGHGRPDEISAKVRADGGVPDDQVVGDCVAAARWLRALPKSNARVGIIGTCSGGRHAIVVGSKSADFDAIADLWGGGVVMAPSDLTTKRPVAPIDLTGDLGAPLLGLFGNDDKSPTPAQVDQHEAELRKHGKEHEFHRYDGAGHGFFYYDRPAYRAEQAADGWAKVFAFFRKHLGAQVEDDMCTNIAAKTRVAGSAKTALGWVAVDEALVGFDHATHAWVEHAVRLDFTSERDGSESVAVELDLASGKALLARLGEVIAAAERSGVET